MNVGKMKSERRNRRFYVFGGLAVIVLAVYLNYITLTSVLYILVILACSIVALNLNSNETRHLDSGSSWFLPGFLRSSKSATSKELTSSASEQYSSESRLQATSRSRRTPGESTMSFRNYDNSPGGSRFSRSFGAVKSFLRSPKITFGGSSPVFSPKIGQHSSASSSMQSPASLPKVHRIRDSFHSGASAYDSRPMASAHRRYPTHQPQYSGLGLMPPVHFNKAERTILSERNSNMIHSPVTVKIAPPDVLKPPVPSLVPTSTANESAIESTQVPTERATDTESVLSAIREKRKRNHKDDPVMQSPEPSQETKRRRHTEQSEPSLETDAMDTETKRVAGLKRPALSKAREESISEMEKSAKKSRLNSSMSGYSSSSGPRNAIDCSFSSSKRWLEKQATPDSQRVTRSQSREVDSPLNKRGRSPEEVRNTEQKRTTRSQSRSRGDSPYSNKRTTNVQDDASRINGTSVEESFSAANTSTPLRDTSSSGAQDTKETVAVSEGDETPLIENVIKKKLFPLKKGSTTKRRQTPIFSPSNANFSKVPSLRYNLTVEDYAEDREADIQRVQQMLEEVDDPDTPKDTLLTKATTSAPASTATVTATVAPSSITLATSTVSTTSSALIALLDSTPGVSLAASATSGITSTSLSKPVTSVQPTSMPSLCPEEVKVSLAKSHGSSNLTSFGTGITSSTESVQNPLLATGAPKLPSFAEATGKTTAPAPASTAAAPQFSFKPVFATDQSSSVSTSMATSSVPTVTNNSSLSIGAAASDKGVAKTTATSGLFSFGANQAVPTATTTNSSAVQFGQTAETKPLTGGFQFNVGTGGSTQTTRASPFQFNSAASSTTSSAPAAPSLPSYASAISSTSSTTSSAFAFGSMSTAAQNPVTTTSSAASTFNFKPTSTGISFGNATNSFTAPAPTTTTASSVGSLPTPSPAASAPSFGQAMTTTSTALKTSAPGIFSFSATNNQPTPFGQSSATTNAAPAFGQATSTQAAPSLFGQTNNQPAPVFGQNTSNATGNVFGQPKQDQKPSSAFQFGGTSQTGGNPAFAFTANSAKPDKIPASSSSAFNFTASKPNTSFGQSGAPSFGAPASSTPFGQSTAPSSFGQTTQNTFGQTNNSGPFGQSSSQNTFGQQASSQNSFGSSAQNTFGSQNGFGKTNQQNAFGSSSNATFGSTSTQSQPSKGFDFGAAASGAANKNTGFSFGGAPGGFGSAQTPAGGSAPTFGSPTPAANPFNAAPSTPQNNMFSMAGGNTAPRPRVAARTTRRRTNKR